MRGHNQLGVVYQFLDRINDWAKASHEPGRSVCECGYLSRNLPDAAARAVWHAKHVAQVQARRNSSTNTQKESTMPKPFKLSEHRLVPTAPGGYSFCTCGAKVKGPLGQPPHGTFAGQRNWHREHIKQVRQKEANRG